MPLFIEYRPGATILLRSQVTWSKLNQKLAIWYWRFGMGVFRVRIEKRIIKHHHHHQYQ